MSSLHSSWNSTCPNDQSTLYLDQIDVLASAKPNQRFLVRQDGLIQKANTFRVIWESIKEFFGGENRTNKKIVEFRAMLLLRQGAEEGLFQKAGKLEQIHSIAKNVGLVEGDAKSKRSHAELDLLVSTISTWFFTKETNSETYERCVNNFYSKHQNELKNPLWIRKWRHEAVDSIKAQIDQMLISEPIAIPAAAYSKETSL